MVQARLLDIAISEFGVKGLDGATTRGIAAAADTAMSSITYHYGGKEGLYLAAADRVAEHMVGAMGGRLARAQGVPDGDAAGARTAIHHILDGLADAMAADQHAELAMFIMREQMNPGHAFDRLYGGMLGQVAVTLVRLVCIATDSDDLEAARIVTVTLSGQVAALRSSRGTLLRLLERERLDDALCTAIKARIAANTDAILDQLIAEQRGHA